MTTQEITADQRAIAVARAIHRMAESEQTILFGSRARGDHRPDSDVDVLIIKDPQPTEDWLEDLRDRARTLQKTELPEASGIDVICMTAQEFAGRRHLRNNLAKQGSPIMPGEPAEMPEEAIDWDDVNGKLKDATGAADGLAAMAGAGIIATASDKQIGRMAHDALQDAYKAVLGAYGFEYPTGGANGHNLRAITELIRQHRILPSDAPVPGENHRYLTDFSGAALYRHDHPPLDKNAIARDVPQAVTALRTLVNQAKRER